ncbi:FecCD family ABC transporter permease [Pelolinea submarina]|uniref:Iron complex transport system permease protein n=1 Tax=Pelolinea submarina TaxID=913107 RepID=A0A347ZTE6_9CHLR|nr:iron ABC transporter permease [Pelolinea submarina]REG10848.1 iron complex transport system permease protein [Pelolinea submarina]BBB48577.1 iron complex transport system permease protein [Pelolinea submarina]
MPKKELGWLGAALVLLIIVSIFIGRYQVPLSLSEFTSNSLLVNLILYIRIPRVLTACLMGFGLAASGLVMQTVFRNPLADPGVLGVSQAAGFGAALGILLFNSSIVATQSLAFIMGGLALAAVLLISRKIKNERIISLVLSGIAVSALFSAGLGVLKYMADPIDQLPTIVFWLLGSLSNVGWKEFLQTALISLPVLIFLWAYRWRLNIHALDKEVAFSLGMKNQAELNIVLFAAVLVTSAIISISGIVVWVGLIIPNLARVISGANNEHTLPFSMLLGAFFTLLCDDLARALLPGEIPLGILTAFLGSMLFILLLVRRRKLV